MVSLIDVITTQQMLHDSIRGLAMVNLFCKASLKKVEQHMRILAIAKTL